MRLICLRNVNCERREFTLPRPRTLDPPALIATLQKNSMRFLCAILAGATAIGFGLRADAALVNGINAIAHDSVITFQEVEDRTALFADQLRQQYGNKPEVLEAKVAEAY